MKRRAVALGLAAIAFFVVFVAVRHVRLANAATHFSRARTTPDDRAKATAALGAIEDIELTTRDGLKLRGWYVAAKRRATVVFVHGGGGNRSSMLPEAKALVARGLGALLYDSRASGESDGDVTTWGDAEQNDLLAALDFVERRGDTAAGHIGVQGHSIGATTVALVAARDKRIGAVLLNATWPSFSDEIHYKFGKYGPLSEQPALFAFRRAGIHPAELDPIDHVAEIAPRPLLVITGDHDIDTPVPVMRRLVDAARAPKSLWVVEGAEHGDYAAHAPDYAERVASFFEGALALR